MRIESKDVEAIAHLARLTLSEADIPAYASSLSSIFELVGQLNAADTEAVDPMAHPLNMVQRLRPDEVTETDQRELFQANASQVEAGLYLVPKVIE